MPQSEENSTEQENHVRIAEIKIDWEVRSYRFRWQEILNQEGTRYNTVYKTGVPEQEFAIRIIMGAS